MSYNQELEDKIDHQYIDREDLRKNKQMGGVGWLINGNMCFGIYKNLLVVRIDPVYVKSLIEKPGIQLFGHREGEFDQFISIEHKIYNHQKALNKFLTHALKVTSDMPPKKNSGKQTPH